MSRKRYHIEVSLPFKSNSQEKQRYHRNVVVLTHTKSPMMRRSNQSKFLSALRKNKFGRRASWSLSGQVHVPQMITVDAMPMADEYIDHRIRTLPEVHATLTKREDRDAMKSPRREAA